MDYSWNWMNPEVNEEYIAVSSALEDNEFSSI